MSINSGKTSSYASCCKHYAGRSWAQLIHWTCKHVPSWKLQMIQDPLEQDPAETRMPPTSTSMPNTNTFIQRPSGPPPLQPSAAHRHPCPQTAKANASPTQTTSPSSYAPSTIPPSQSNTPRTPPRQQSPASRPAASTSHPAT